MVRSRLVDPLMQGGSYSPDASPDVTARKDPPGWF